MRRSAGTSCTIQSEAALGFETRLPVDRQGVRSQLAWSSSRKRLIGKALPSA